MLAGLRNIRTFESLAVRDYRLLWLGQVSTSLGQWMDQVTRAWLIYILTGSAFQLGLTTALRGLPILLFGMVAGALADRSGRKLQLIVAQFTNAALNFILAGLVITGLVQPWHVYVTAFLAGTVQAFQQPARQTLIGDIVGRERLLNALALNSAALNGSRVFGPAISGYMIVLLQGGAAHPLQGIGYSYVVQGIIYLVATVWTLQMRVPDRAAERAGMSREPFFQSMGGGFAYVAKTPLIRSQIALALGPLTFAMAYTSLMPIIVLNVLHGDAALQGRLLSFIGMGALLGALTVASMKRTHAYGLSVVIGAAMFCLGVLMFASSSSIWLSCGLGVLLGMFNVTYTTQNQTLLQLSAPRHIRGRVMSVWLLNRGTVPFGALLAGILAEQYGGQDALRIMALLGLAVVAIVVATNPAILRQKVPLASDDDVADRPAAVAAGGASPVRSRAGAPD